MNEEVLLALKKFSRAAIVLKKGTQEAGTQLERDGVIQRFEFTFESFWKCLKIILEDQGVIAKTPKECLKEAFRVGLLSNEETFLDMLEDRNKMSHLYDEQEAHEIFLRIKKNYAAALDQTAKFLKQKR